MEICRWQNGLQDGREICSSSVWEQVQTGRSRWPGHHAKPACLMKDRHRSHSGLMPWTKSSAQRWGQAWVSGFEIIPYLLGRRSSRVQVRAVSVHCVSGWLQSFS